MSERPALYFVTGAAGFIGRSLCRQLRAAGRPVRALVRGQQDPRLTAFGVEQIVGDLLDPASYRSALQGVDVVLHAGAKSSFGDGPEYQAANVTATERLLDSAREFAPSLRRFVFVSTLGAVDREPGDRCEAPVDESYPPHPSTDYGRSKLAAEERVRASGLPWTIVRPTLVGGVEMRFDSHLAVFARQALRGSLVSRLRFPGRMSLVHVEDVVRALLLVADHPGAANRTFFIAGEAVPLGTIYDWCAPGARLSLAPVRAALRPFVALLPFKPKAVLFDCLVAEDAALRALGWHPQRSAKDMVVEVAAAQRRHLDARLPPPGWTLVTGAASGLGRALAEQLAARGRRLILADRDGDALTTVAAGSGVIERVCIDLAHDAGVDALLALPQWTGEGVDEVFACAGIGVRGEFARVDVKQQAECFGVNVLSRLRLAHHAIQFMRPRRFGRVVLISSSSAFQPLPYMAVYAATNAALLSFGEGIWAELRGTGIQVLTVCPGGMRTQFQRRAGVLELPEEKLLEPEAVALAILGALGRESPTILVGGRAVAMALAARLLPRKVTLLLWRALMGKLR